MTSGILAGEKLPASLPGIEHIVPYHGIEPDDRMPLILIHGIGPEKGEYFNWGRFLKYAEQNPEFKKRFKVYLFHFNPADPLDKSAGILRDSLKKFLARNGEHPFRVIALSQGGIVFRRAYEDPDIRQATDRIITVGTPFHGTPLANRYWMKAQTKNNSVLDPLRYTLGLTYGVVENKFPNFMADYCWDNVDLGLDTRKNGNPDFRCRGTDRPLFNTARFITYGSFFDVETEAQSYLLEQLDCPLDLPREKSVGLFSRARLFDLAGGRISGMPLANGETVGYPLMIYNDGVTPISSSLWLGRFTNGETAEIRQKILWQAIKGLKNTDQARLFAGMDHQNWMLGTTRTSSNNVADLLNPDDPARPVFDWFIHDLLSE